MEVSIVRPSSNEIIDCTTEGTVIPLCAEVKNADKADVTFYVDGVVVGTGSEVDWIPTDKVGTIGETKSYTIVAKAKNAKGEEVISDKVTIMVKLPAKEIEEGTQTVKVTQSKGAAISNSINMNLEVVNIGEEMNLADLEIRYYFNTVTGVEQKIWCDHSALQMNVSPWYVTLNSDLETAVVDLGNGTSYISVQPSSAISFVNNGKFILQARVCKADWSNYDQSDYFSYNNGVAVYYRGQLIEGLEP